MANSPRELAYNTLLAAEKDSSRNIDDLLGNAFNSGGLTPQEKAWTMELVYGVTRMKLQLDGMIQTAFKGRYHKAQHAIKTLLRMGTFQLKHMHTQEHAAINETVNLSKKVKQRRASGLVNAVLRKIQKIELKELLESIDDDMRRISIEYSHPEWLLEKWSQRYEPAEITALCQTNNSAPGVWIRRNVQKVGSQEFETFLEHMDVKFEKSKILDSFYALESNASLFSSKEFHRGWFSAQDLAAGIVASLISPHQGDIIVDACAAPGGKMAYIAEIADPSVKIIAGDASHSRLLKVKENIQRLNLTGVEVQQLDATTDVMPIANKILLDVPCSGTGVLSRRPDARWKRQITDTDSLTGIQSKILRNSWNYLTPGGFILYATCTLEPEENWELIDSVMQDLKDAEIEAIEDQILKPYVDERGALSTLPWKHGMDGMFAVKIRKVK